MTDRAHAYFAAVDTLRAGGVFDDALAAARDALRPGGVTDWLETSMARAAAVDAFENHNRECAANARMDEMRSAAE